MFAHNDATPMRRVIDVASFVGAVGGILIEEYEPIEADQWQRVVDLADGQGKRFYDRELELRSELNLPRPDPV